MFEESHNQNSKKLMKKILLFIDNVCVNAGNSKPDEVCGVLTGGLLNIRDALLSEIVRDNHVAQINQILKEQDDKKNQKEDEEDINQEKE